MFRRSTLGAALALALLAPAAHAQIADPAKTFSRWPDYSDPQLSPTGEFIAVDSPDGWPGLLRAFAEAASA